MIIEPPLAAGAVQLTVAVVLPAVAAPIAGAPGNTSGDTEFDRAEKSPAPEALIPATWNLTAVPATSPVMTKLVATGSAVVRRTPT